MGEFVLALSVAESLTGHKFTAKETETLLRRRLDAFGRFYMHVSIFIAVSVTCACCQTSKAELCSVLDSFRRTRRRLTSTRRA